MTYGNQGVSTGLFKKGKRGKMGRMRIGNVVGLSGGGIQQVLLHLQRSLLKSKGVRDLPLKDQQ